MLLLDGNAHSRELHRYVAARSLAVVGQEGKGNITRQKPADKLLRAGNELLTTIDHAIHVDQKSVRPHHNLLHEPETKKTADSADDADVGAAFVADRSIWPPVYPCDPRYPRSNARL